MDSDLSDHLFKCRCCIAALPEGSDNWMKITKSVQKQFFEVVGIQLNLSDLYSSIICNVCKKQLNKVSQIRRKFSQNQERLNKFVEEQENYESEKDSKSFQADLENFPADPFEVFNVSTEEVEIKEEKCDEDCVKEVKIPVAEMLVEVNLGKSQKEKKLKTKVESDKLSYRKCYKLCTICGANLKYESYYVHMRAHRNAMNNVFFYCDHCKYKSHRKNSLVAHIYKHQSNESKPVFQCEKCPKFFYRRKRLNSHDKKKHQEREPDQPVNCDICGKECKNRNALYAHRHSVHRQKVNPERADSKFPCDHCDEIFSTQIATKNHFDLRHAPKSPCEVCGKMVGPGHAMRLHRVLHSDKVKCPFEGCGKLLANKSSLRTHFKYKHNTDEAAKCDICGSEYKSQYRLKVHIKRHHVAEKKACEVPGCNHLTTRPSYLIKHYRSHQDIDETEKDRLIQEVIAKGK